MSEFILKKMNEWEFLKLKRKRESLKYELKEINQKIQREEEIRERIEKKEYCSLLKQIWRLIML